MTDDTPVTRRTVLRTTGGALAVGVGAAGTATAGTRAYAVREVDVRDACAGDVIGTVSEDAEGDVLDSCTDSDGNGWVYVDWDEETPDGWAQEGYDVVLYA
jgi:hypothetical protein